MSQIHMQGKLLKCTKTMSQLCNDFAGDFAGMTLKMVLVA